MKEPDLTLCGRASISRSLSPVLNRESQILSPSAAKARGIRESCKFSWDGYEIAIARNEEEYKPGSISPPPGSPSQRPSQFSSPSLSPMHSPSRGPSPDSGANPTTVAQAGPDAFPTPTKRRPSKRQSVQIATPVEIDERFSGPPDLYSFPRSKSHVRFSRSLPKFPDEIPSIQRSASPVDFQDGVPIGPVGTSPIPGFGHDHGHPRFLSHQPDRGCDGERRTFFGDNYGYGDAAVPKLQEPKQPIKNSVGQDRHRLSKDVNSSLSHSKKLAIACRLLRVPCGKSIRVKKNPTTIAGLRPLYGKATE